MSKLAYLVPVFVLSCVPPSDETTASTGDAELIAKLETGIDTTPAQLESGGSCPAELATPKRQLRAMWIASVAFIDWPSAPGLDADALRAEYRGWLDLAQQDNFNAVVVQVRPTADAFWPSAYEPWSQYVTGVRGLFPGWDPLAFLVEETHARNLEFHAWFNPYRVSMPAPSGAGPNIDQLAANHPVRVHPDWAVAYPASGAGSRLYYNPGIPEVRQFVENAILDAVSKYDIDGVHFDDYFYPYPVGSEDFADDATFATYGAGYATKAEWRRHNIDVFVQEMNERVHTLKPWVKLGISPFGIWRNHATDPLGSDTGGLQSYDAIGADTRKWVKEGWLDYVAPQIYWNIGLAVADYAKLVPWWADVVDGTQVQLYIGQADYRIGSSGAWLHPDELSNHFIFNRSYPQVSGDIHFSANSVRTDALGGVSQAVATQYARPALVPRMPHLPAKPLLLPLITHATRDATTGTVTLTIKPLLDDVGPLGKATSHVVYRFDGTVLPSPCDFADASHLMGTVRAGEQFVDRTALSGHSYTYVATSLDRLWNESHASPPWFVF